MSFCPNQPITFTRRVARVVPNGTAGAVSTMSDLLLVTLPSPRVQCLISYNALPSDRANTGTYFAFNNDGASTWILTPALDLTTNPDFKNYATIIPSSWPASMAGGGIIGAPRDVAADGQNWGAAYLLKGETTRLWLVQLTSGMPAKSSAAPAGYLIFQATFEPIPEANMSREEWGYWSARCAVAQLVGNNDNPPVLQATP